MGMNATHNKAEDSLSLDTQWLKNHDYFCGYRSGGITWTWGWTGNQSSIGFTVDTSCNFPKIRFQYSLKHWSDKEKKQMDYSFPLVKVPCNLGGYRWAFRCVLVHNGVYCGRVVYKLFLSNSDYFGCRKCMRIVYDSQRKSGGSLQFLGKVIDMERKAKELYRQIHKWTYQGKPTKKALKYQQLVNQIPSLDQMALMEATLILNKTGR
jgi:hypothetical protein